MSKKKQKVKQPQLLQVVVRTDAGNTVKLLGAEYTMRSSDKFFVTEDSEKLLAQAKQGKSKAWLADNRLEVTVEDL